jgi:predicted amidohydrolase
VRVVVAQLAPGTPFSHLRRILAARAADLYALPEYLTAVPTETGAADTASHYHHDLEALRLLSRDLGGILLGGTLIEPTEGGFYNTAPVLESGELRGLQRKHHPTSRERNRGIVAGTGFTVVKTGAGRVAALICADVLAGDSFRRVAEQEPDVVFVPTTSPLRAGEPRADKERRDRDIFLAGARQAGAFVIKAGAVGSVYGQPLQGRSLIAAPWGMFLARVPPEDEAEELLLTAELDWGRLARWRAARRTIE